MRNILIVAKTEFFTAVRSKAFVVSLLMLPLIYAVAIGVQIFAGKADTKPRTFAVVDQTGMLFAPIKQAADDRRKGIVDASGKAKAPDFIPVEARSEGVSLEEYALTLSEQVRAGKLDAFVEIPAIAVDAGNAGVIELKYYSDNPNYRDLREWLERVIAEASRKERYRAAGLEPSMAQKIDKTLLTSNLGLFSRETVASTPSSETPGAKKGKIVAAQRIDPIRSFIVPGALAFIVFLITMSSAPQLLTTVMEEKMSRISEMLLGSVSTFELMMGKLIGNAGTALLSSLLYLGGAYIAAYRYGYADAISPWILATLALFVTLSVLLFGSLYMAIGSACSEFKDAQSMMMPVMMLSMIPFFVLGPVISNPSGTLAVVASLIPFASPILMPMRMAMSPAPPMWQIVLSIVLTGATAMACVWASGKIFRTALLMHGKAPTFGEMFKWVMARS